MSEYGMIYVRHRNGDSHPPRKFGPRGDGRPGPDCPACRVPLAPGDYTALVIIGPGDDSEARGRARDDRYYNAVAIEAHWSCVTGETTIG